MVFVAFDLGGVSVGKVGTRDQGEGRSLETGEGGVDWGGWGGGGVGSGEVVVVTGR